MKVGKDMNHLVEPFNADEPVKLTGIKQAPPTPPSRAIHKRDAAWGTDVSIACYYLYGRMDMGETRDTNDNYRFAEAWADAKWEFRTDLHKRSFLPTLADALKAWDAREAF